MTPDTALDLCEELLDLLPTLPEEAGEFSQSVFEKTASIQSWIATHNEVTDKQAKALTNMLKGAKRWARD